MKRTVKVKNLIAFTAVLILLFSITAVPAYAEFPPLTTAGRRLGAFLLSAIQAINITLTSTAAQSPGADIMNYIADPLDVQYSYSEMWEDQPKIQIWKDYINIDGEEYTDIWLSNEAATKFQVDAYDFKSAYNIASNSNGTFVSGEGTSAGLPMFDVDGTIRSQSVFLEYPQNVGVKQYNVGDWGVAIEHASGAPVQRAWAFPSSMPTYGSITVYSPFDDGTYEGYVRKRSGTNYCDFILKGKQYNDSINPGNNNYRSVFISDPFDFDYVSDNIPAQEVLDPDEGMMLRIPSNSIPEITQFVTDNPEFAEPGGAPIDINLDPDIMNKLDDLINIIAPIIPVINNLGDVQFTVNHTEPQPEPGLPDTVFPDTQVDDALQPVINTINNNTQNIIESIPAPSEITQPIIQEIQDTGDEIIENIPKIDEICNNIDTAPYHDLDTGLDHLPSIFLPFITDLRSALGIWHYVTEWISQISTTFAFITGCLVGTSIMTPIYAAIAGFMCIKVYRRMTG